MGAKNLEFLVDLDSLNKSELLDIIKQEKEKVLILEKEKEAFISSSFDGYWDWHIQEDYEYISAQFWKMLGHDFKEKKYNPEKRRQLIFKEDLKLTSENFKKHCDSKGEFPFKQEIRYRHKDGTTVYVICRGKVVDWGENDEPLRMIGTQTNITHLKIDLTRSSQCPEVESLKKSFYKLDLDTGEVHLHSKIRKILGYDENDTLTFEKIFRNNLNSVKKLLNKNKNKHHSITLKVYSKTNKFHWLYCCGEKGAGVLFGYFIIIDELKEKEKKLQNTTLELERSNKLLEEFAYLVSHDLKAPVRHIKNYISFLEEAIEEGNEDEIKEFLASVQKSANKMGLLIDDIIKLSKCSSANVEKEMVNLNEILEEVKQVTVSSSKEKQVVINGEILCDIFGNKVLLEHLFQNLLTNSIKYNDKSEVHIDITCHEKEETIEIVFKDNGIGFSEEDSEVIFQPFKRLVTKNTYEGTGIGLAICKTVIENHDGSIVANGEKGKGAIFTINFPRQS